MKRKTTLKEIADRLNLSTATVSRALRGLDGIGEETRKTIIELARSLDYKVNKEQQALSLLSGRTAFLITPNNSGNLFSEAFLSIMQAFQDDNLKIEVLKLNLSEQNDSVIKSLKKAKPDFIFLHGRNKNSFVAELLQLNLPLFAIDMDFPFAGVDSIMANDYQGATSAIEYLHRNGYREIGFIGDNQLAPSFRYRYHGFIDALTECNLPIRKPYIYNLHFQDDDDIRYNVIEQSLNYKELPEAFFCANDAIAYFLINSLNKQGVRVPEDVAVIGFDNLEWSAMQVTPLTTVHYPCEHIGATLNRLVKWRMTNPSEPSQKILIGTHLVERESAPIRR